MNLDAITVELLEETLKAWKSYREPPAILLDMALLGASSSDLQKEREILLREQLEKIVFEMLVLNRNNTNQTVTHPAKVSISKDHVLQNLRDDFSSGNSELEAWSAVYHLYLISPDFNMSVSELADTAMPGMTKDKPSQFRRRVKEGLNRFVTALQKAEFQARQHPRELPLPSPEYSKLFGVEDMIHQIYDWLKTPDDSGPFFVSIEALGGWGKTALARAVASRFLVSGFFTEIVWVSARQEALNDSGKIRQIQDPARSTDDIVTHLAEKFIPGRLAGLSRESKIEQLKSILPNKPYLVIIDNLETLLDIEDLIPAIYPLAGKTRFLLTSRASFGKFPSVQCIRVPELSRSDSLALIQSELHRKDRQVALSNEEMDKIYSVVGGVPLALKLIASQLKYLSLTRILEGLREARQRTPEAIYTYIYRRTWQELLDESARLLLLSLQHIPSEGEDETGIYENSLLPRPDFEAALAQLLDCALLEMTGALNAPLYHLHQLTVTFLQTEILLGWQGGDMGGN